MNILFMIKVEILVLIKRSNTSSQIMLIFESTMVIIFWAYSPIVFEHVSYWHLLLEPHLTTYHSTIGVQIREVAEICTSTLLRCDLIHNICRGQYHFYTSICHEFFFIYSYTLRKGYNFWSTISLPITWMIHLCYPLALRYSSTYKTYVSHDSSVVLLQHKHVIAYKSLVLQFAKLNHHVYANKSMLTIAHTLRNGGNITCWEQNLRLRLTTNLWSICPLKQT